MKIYVRSSQDVVNITDIKSILSPYVGTDKYIQIKYYNSAAKHYDDYRILYIKILKLSDRTCEARCYDSISMNTINPSDVMYPPTWRRLRLDRIDVPDELKTFTFNDLVDMVGHHRSRTLNMPEPSMMQFY